MLDSANRFERSMTCRVAFLTRIVDTFSVVLSLVLAMSWNRSECPLFSLAGRFSPLPPRWPWEDLKLHEARWNLLVQIGR